MPNPTFFNLPAERQEHLIERAIDVHLQKPYEEVTVLDLVKAMGIPVGSFYRYFTDKDEIYLYILDQITLKSLDNTGFGILNPRMWPQTIEDGLVSPKYSKLTERERKMVHRFYDAPENVMRRYCFEYAKNRICSQYSREFDRLKQLGVVRADVNVELTAYLYSTLSYNLFSYFKENNITDQTQRNALIENMVSSMLVNGIYSESAAGREPSC